MNHEMTEEYFELNIANELLPVTMVPTRVNHTTKTLIDNIYFKNTKHAKFQSGVILSDISDHCPCILSVQQSMELPKETKVAKSWKLDNDKIFKINNELLHHDWLHLDNMNVNEGYQYFSKILSDNVEIYAPIKTLKIPPKKVLREKMDQ